MRKLISLSAAGLIACIAMVVDSLVPGPLRLPDGLVAVVWVALIPTVGGVAFTIWWRQDGMSRQTMAELRQALPTWVKYGVVAIVAGAMIHFAYFIAAGGDGTAEPWPVLAPLPGAAARTKPPQERARNSLTAGAVGGNATPACFREWLLSSRRDYWGESFRSSARANGCRDWPIAQ